MKKIFIVLLSLSLIFGVTGCAFLRGTKQNTENQEVLDKKVKQADLTKDNINKNDANRMSQTATLAAGVQYSLNKVTNAPNPVITALKLNERIVSIVGSPDISEVKKIQEIVDLLNSAVTEEKLAGQKLLDIKDSEILDLQKENSILRSKYDGQVEDLMNKAKIIAKGADEKQTTLDSMSGMFGLNAVWWGLKRFIFSSLATLIIIIIVFLVLRILSATNPIAASIFSVFNFIGAGFIKIIKGIVPKSIEVGKFVNLSDHIKYKSILIKIIDTIEELKRTTQASNKEYTLTEVLNKFDSVFDKQDKDVVDEIVKEQKWT
jgi:xanthosine utilization system XapX-like protein